MGKIFIGFILVFIDINILGFDLVNDLIGFVFFFQGMRELQSISDTAKVATNVALVLCVISFILQLFPTIILLAIINSLIYLYFTYLLVLTVIDIERFYNQDLRSKELFQQWKIFMVSHLLLLLLMLANTSLFAIVIAVIGFIINICFIFSYYNCQKLYYNYIKE